MSFNGVFGWAELLVAITMVLGMVAWLLRLEAGVKSHDSQLVEDRAALVACIKAHSDQIHESTLTLETMKSIINEMAIRGQATALLLGSHVALAGHPETLIEIGRAREATARMEEQLKYIVETIREQREMHGERRKVDRP